MSVAVHVRLHMRRRVVEQGRARERERKAGGSSLCGKTSRLRSSGAASPWFAKWARVPHRVSAALWTSFAAISPTRASGMMRSARNIQSTPFMQPLRLLRTVAPALATQRNPLAPLGAEGRFFGSSPGRHLRGGRKGFATNHNAPSIASRMVANKHAQAQQKLAAATPTRTHWAAMSSLTHAEAWLEQRGPVACVLLFMREAGKGRDRPRAFNCLEKRAGARGSSSAIWSPSSTLAPQQFSWVSAPQNGPFAASSRPARYSAV